MSLYNEEMFDEDEIMEEGEEELEDQVKAAKNALTKATDDLNRLADYCENRFNEPLVIYDNGNGKYLYYFNF